jgi:hypothetical protein
MIFFKVTLMLTLIYQKLIIFVETISNQNVLLIPYIHHILPYINISNPKATTQDNNNFLNVDEPVTLLKKIRGTLFSKPVTF